MRRQELEMKKDEEKDLAEGTNGHGREP
jgi:hypothetical protein